MRKQMTQNSLKDQIENSKLPEHETVRDDLKMLLEKIFQEV